MNSTSIVIPAYNEEKRIGKVIDHIKDQGCEVVVIDDASADNTSEVAKKRGARVVRNPQNLGYLKTIKRGFRETGGDIIVTIDADGEHDPGEIPRLVEPVQRGNADLVMGRREKGEIRISERILSWISAWKTGIRDSGTGFRAIRRNLALRLELKAICPCGIFALEAHRLGARIAEVPITVQRIDKRRSTAWRHFGQFFYLMRMMMK